MTDANSKKESPFSKIGKKFTTEKKDYIKSVMEENKRKISERKNSNM